MAEPDIDSHAKPGEPPDEIAIAGEVQVLLAASRAAHQVALEARQARQTVQADSKLREAHATRMEADRLDPYHHAPAWSDGAEAGMTPRGRHSHEDLMGFYGEQMRATKRTPGDG